jgi:membrane protein implicated in regulation of membrane protease activity
MSSIVEHAWIGWVLVAVAAGLLELLVPYFTFTFVSGAAAVCALCSLWVSFPAQIIIFCVVGLSSLILLRPIFLKKLHFPHKMHSRSQQLMDMTGDVTESIDNNRGTGRVSVNGEDWLARADHVIVAGQVIRVVGADGIVLLVKEV